MLNTISVGHYHVCFFLKQLSEIWNQRCLVEVKYINHDMSFNAQENVTI